MLTAAHCCEGAEDILIFAADHDQYDYYEGFEQEYTADRIIIHPGYDSDTLNRDICILKLKSNESFETAKDNDIEYACLPEPDETVEPGTKCWTAGWGTLESGGSLPEELQVGCPQKIKNFIFVLFFDILYSSARILTLNCHFCQLFTTLRTQTWPYFFFAFQNSTRPYLNIFST